MTPWRRTATSHRQTHLTTTSPSATFRAPVKETRTQGGKPMSINQITRFISFSLFRSVGLFAGISLPSRISANFAGGAMNDHSEN